MSVKVRRGLTAFSVVLWIAWLLLAWLAASTTHESTTLELFGEEVTRLAAVTLTIAILVCWAVCPLVATARIWMEIGRRESQCDCMTERQQAVGGVVVPIRRHNAHSDN